MIWVGELLLWALLAALGSVGLTLILRNAPVIRGWVQAGKKPWACNVCMPLYTSAAVVAVPVLVMHEWNYALAFPAAYALGHWMLDRTSRPPPGPPPMLLPDDLEEDDS